jgi:RNA polymerase-binding transcription factor DksA
MDSTDITEKDNATMFAEWQRKRISIGVYEADPNEQRRCVTCGKLIPLKRLLVNPNTNYCSDCVRKMQEGLYKEAKLWDQMTQM